MHTDSSASRTCRLSRSAWLKTATVEILSSRQARITRRAISPRLAIRTLRNMPSSGHPIGRWRRRPCRTLITALAGRARGLGPESSGPALLHRLPGAVRRALDALELEHQLVRLVAVLERVLLGDEPVAQQPEHRLVEGLHAVLREPLGHDLVHQGYLVLGQQVLADRRRADHDLHGRYAALAIRARDQTLRHHG